MLRVYIAPLDTLQERCIAAPGLVAAVIVGKYCDHLPLYRQQQIFATRHGVEIPRQTMAQWMGLAADWLRPIYEHIRTGVLGGGYVQVDETPIEYLVPGNGGDQARLPLGLCAPRWRHRLRLAHQPRRRLPGTHHPVRLPRHRAERRLCGLPCLRAPAQRRRRTRGHHPRRLLGAREARVH